MCLSCYMQGKDDGGGNLELSLGHAMLLLPNYVERHKMVGTGVERKVCT